jgi:hypothetical protein
VLVASAAGAGGQALDASRALKAHLGSRTRFWTSINGSERRFDGQIQFVHDTIFTVWSTNENRLVDLPVASLDRLAIIRPQHAFAVPAAMAAGMAAGGAAAYMATRGAPPADAQSITRRRTITLSALAGAYVFFWVGELVIPEQRWVTVFKR